jgi:hypothetical protein
MGESSRHLAPWTIEQTTNTSSNTAIIPLGAARPSNTVVVSVIAAGFIGRLPMTPDIRGRLPIGDCCLAATSVRLND